MSTPLSLCLAVIAMLLLNFPLILIWDRDVTVAGLPLLPVALFAVWALLIVVLALGGGRRSPPSG